MPTSDWPLTNSTRVYWGIIFLSTLFVGMLLHCPLLFKWQVEHGIKWIPSNFLYNVQEIWSLHVVSSFGGVCFKNEQPFTPGITKVINQIPCLCIHLTHIIFKLLKFSCLWPVKKPDDRKWTMENNVYHFESNLVFNRTQEKYCTGQLHLTVLWKDCFN